MNVTPSGGSAANKSIIESGNEVNPYATSYGGTIASGENPAIGIHTFSSNHTVNSIGLFAGIGRYKQASAATITISSAELYVIRIPL